MAKLSSRGRTELARVSKEAVMPDVEVCSSCEGTGKYAHDQSTCHNCKGEGKAVPSTTWERVTLALMSDRTILKKLDVKFRPTAPWDPPNGRPHTWGWKVNSKVKPEVDATRFIEYYTKRGYQVK